MAVLNFIGYSVVDMAYQSNSGYKKTGTTIDLRPKITKNIEIKANLIYVTLVVSVGSLNDEKYPFKVGCSLRGTFEYQSDEDKEKTGVDQLARTNAMAILFPYARQIITMLTTASNEYPGYIIPTINVNKFIDDQESQIKKV